MLLWAGVREILLTTALVALYFVWPIDALPSSWRDFVGPILCLVAFIAVLAWQLRAILSSNLPELRTLEALVIVGTLFIVLTSLAYLYFDSSTPQAFSEPLSRMAALYFTVTVFATVGFGDITATTDATRAAVTVQMILNVVLVGFIVKVLLGTAKVSLKRGATAPGDHHDQDP